MEEYLKTVVSTVLAVGIISVIVPKGSFSKYVDILSGAIVMVVIVSPFISSAGGKISFEQPDIQYLLNDTNSYIMEEYEKELSHDIKKMLKERTNIDFSVSVRADKHEDTIEINEIQISPYSSEYSALISDFFGVDEGRIIEK